MRLTPKNWAEFQHYKDRRPAWIKLHKSTLDDFKFQSLPVASRALAPMLWLLASEYEGGIITADLTEIAFRLHRSKQETEEALKPLIDNKFFTVEQAASAPLAQAEQVAMPEKRREEKRREDPAIPSDSDSQVFRIAKAYPKLSHLNNEMEIKRSVTDMIIRAIETDGFEKVLAGVNAYKKSLDNAKYASDPYTFFEGYDYRLHLPQRPKLGMNPAEKTRRNLEAN